MLLTLHCTSPGKQSRARRDHCTWSQPSSYERTGETSIPANKSTLQRNRREQQRFLYAAPLSRLNKTGTSKVGAISKAQKSAKFLNL